MPQQVALYIHVPFCIKKCNYCDFLSFNFNEELAEKYLELILKELSLYREQKGKVLVPSIYFGGGTPTLLKYKLLDILDKITDLFVVESGCEITLEANPKTVEYSFLKSLRKNGFNRISLGIQTFNPDLLSFLGRLHGPEEAKESIIEARRAGFDNLSCDIIYAIPGQTPENFRQDLIKIVDFSPEHVSLYNLKIEPGTVLESSLKRGEFDEFDPDLETEMFQEAIYFLKDRGYEHYEISNFGLPGYASRHNQIYWDFKPYWGLGPGAHGYTGEFLYHNTGVFEDYARAINLNKLPMEEKEHLNLNDRMIYFVILGLRKLSGINLSNFKKHFKRDFDTVYGKEKEELINLGLLVQKGDFLRLTERGLFLANEVWEKFV